MIAGIDIQNSAMSTSLSFRALSRLAFLFVRDQLLIMGMLAWFVRNRRNGEDPHD